jgi:hypothetical protein
LGKFLCALFAHDLGLAEAKSYAFDFDYLTYHNCGGLKVQTRQMAAELYPYILLSISCLESRRESQATGSDLLVNRGGQGPTREEIGIIWPSLKRLLGAKRVR